MVFYYLDLFLIFIHKRNKMASLNIFRSHKMITLTKTLKTYNLQNNIKLKLLEGGIYI